MHVDVLAPIADHSMVSMVMDINTVATENAERNIWIFKQAKWQALRTELNAIAWHDVFGEDFSDNASKITEIVLSSSKQHIPFRKHRFRKSLHPWLTDTTFEAIQAKVAAYGTCSYDDAAKACSQVFAKEYATHVKRLRTTLASLPRGSKRWWRVNRELLDKKASLSSISPLKASDGRWLLDPIDKANELANTFMNKSKLPPAVPQQDFAAPAVEMSGFILIRARVAKRALKIINEDKATGPDSLPGKIIKMCHAELAGPIARFSRLLVLRGVWPDCWRNHWVCPLHKRGAVSNSSNYRGVHLTSI